MLLVAGCTEGGGIFGDKEPPGPAGHARVTKVVDGDTIHLAGLGSVRLIGVDTPETNAGPECFGEEATRFTAKRLAPGTVVEYRLGTEPQDRYGRALAYVWEPDGTFFNEELVKEGFATALSIRPNTEYADRFERLADKARELGLGLWSPDECGPDGPSG